MKSSFSGKQGNCIEVEGDGSIITIRETQTVEDLGVTHLPWENQSLFTDRLSFKAFIDGVKAGEFDHFVGE